MSSNKLIVESKNDKIFFQALINHLNLQNIEIDPICMDENDYICMGGLDNKTLTKALKDLITEIQKGGVDKIGIIIDIDNNTETDKIDFINISINKAFEKSPSIKKVEEFIQITIDDLTIDLACYFTNVDGQGELDTVLKTIACKDTTYANCLESWKECIKAQGIEINDKQFNKFWVSNYLRFDTCKGRDKYDADRKCSMKNFDYIMENKKDIWNFEHSILEDLNKFLLLFK